MSEKKLNNRSSENISEVDTSGGTYIGNDVNAGRDFAGRDIHHINNYYYQGDSKPRTTLFATDESPLQPNVPFQAIAPPYIFLGRDQEISLLVQNLLSDIPIAIIRSGVGGIGKTALAAYVSHELRDRFPAGILWARLDTDDTFSILASFISALDVDGIDKLKYLDTVNTRASYYRSLLSNKRCLIVLDNTETVEQVIPLLPVGSTNKVLITTRYSLANLQQKKFELHIQSLNDSSAVDLLFDSLGKEKNPNEYPTAVQLCSILGCLPLAIRVAAGIIKELGWELHDYLERVQQSALFDWLNDGTSQSVQASFEISYTNLPNDSVRETFRALGIFLQASFSASLVAYTLGISNSEAEHKLLVLIRRGLIESDEVTSRRYFRIHPLLHRFAEKLVKDLHEYKTLHLSAGHYYRSKISRWDETNKTFLDYEGFVSTDDVENGLSAAFHYLHAGDYATTQDVLAIIANTFSLHGNERVLAARIQELAQFTTLTPWLQLCLAEMIVEEKAKGEITIPAAIAMIEALTNHQAPKMASAALISLAAVRAKQHRFEEANQYLKRSLQMKAQMIPPDQRGTAFIQNELARICSSGGGTPNQALDFHKKALEIQERLSDTVGIAYTLRKMASIYLHHLNDVKEASQLLSRSEMLARSTGDKIGLISILTDKARILQYHKNYDEALEVLKQAYKLTVDCNNRIGEAYVLKGLGNLCEEMGRIKEAFVYINQSHMIFEDFDPRNAKRSKKHVARLERQISDLTNECVTLEMEINHLKEAYDLAHHTEEANAVKKRLRFLWRRLKQLKYQLAIE